MTDTQPRYTTKRLHDEIDHARRLGRLEALQEAAAIIDDSVGEFEKAAGGSDGVAHDAMLLAGDALELVRDAIREKISAVPASAPREEIFPKYRNLVNGDLCELVSQGVDGVAFRRVGSTQLAYLGHPEFTKRFEEVPPAPLPISVGDDGPRYSMKRMRDEIAKARAQGRVEIVDQISDLATAETDVGPVFNRAFLDNDTNFDRFMAIISAVEPAAPAELSVGTWLPIERADKEITNVEDFSEVGVTIRTSDRYWVRDDDGRVYEAAWSEGENGRNYWWDFEGESPVDPFEFMPHPLDPRFHPDTNLEDQPCS
ncbi:hypothetical protein ACIQUB_06040 [Rhizobium sp. NPDC090275]|uniref:hypothetical protein n=1 Tax=Rhizobium sp. NPDC090275 TaxID=3364498 RepID=UPI00383B8550